MSRLEDGPRSSSRAAAGAVGARPATIRDVAERAGVSRAAVSKVIRNAYGVSASMRREVEAAIAELDYRPRTAARAMRGASFTLGMEIPQIGNEFLSLVIEGAADALAGSEYQLIVAPIRVASQGDRTLRGLVDRQMDGIIAVSPRVSSEWLADLARSTPLVMVGRHDVSAHYDTVAGADEAGANEVMTHLIELGHRRIAFLTLDHHRPGESAGPGGGGPGRPPPRGGPCPGSVPSSSRRRTAFEQSPLGAPQSHGSHGPFSPGFGPVVHKREHTRFQLAYASGRALPFALTHRPRRSRRSLRGDAARGQSPARHAAPARRRAGLQ
jgi:transcriptional regulator with XRE-family HTH domain